MRAAVTPRQVLKVERPEIDAVPGELLPVREKPAGGPDPAIILLGMAEEPPVAMGIARGLPLQVQENRLHHPLPLDRKDAPVADAEYVCGIRELLEYREVDHRKPFRTDVVVEAHGLARPHVTLARPVVDIDPGPPEEDFRADHDTAARDVEVGVKVHVDHGVGPVARYEGVARLVDDADLVKPRVEVEELADPGRVRPVSGADEGERSHRHEVAALKRPGPLNRSGDRDAEYIPEEPGDPGLPQPLPFCRPADDEAAGGHRLLVAHEVEVC